MNKNNNLQLNRLVNQAFEVCTCGHIRFHHEEVAKWCIYSNSAQRPSDVQCGCDGFRRDNLRYLEEIACGKK